jgi:hypothetical protein
MIQYSLQQQPTQLVHGKQQQFVEVKLLQLFYLDIFLRDLLHLGGKELELIEELGNLGNIRQLRYQWKYRSYRERCLFGRLIGMRDLLYRRHMLGRQRDSPFDTLMRYPSNMLQELMKLQVNLVEHRHNYTIEDQFSF